jgi:hypothetical protein
MFSAMGVWTSLEPQLPPHKGESTEFAALYRIEFWKMDLVGRFNQFERI